MSAQLQGFQDDLEDEEDEWEAFSNFHEAKGVGKTFSMDVGAFGLSPVSPPLSPLKSSPSPVPSSSAAGAVEADGDCEDAGGNGSQSSESLGPSDSEPASLFSRVAVSFMTL